MVSHWGITLPTLLYVCVLFGVAYWGDKPGAYKVSHSNRATIYALTLAIYLTAWSYYGTVGLTLGSGLDFLTLYIAPFLLFLFGAPVIRRMAQIVRKQRSTSVADFIAARYEKSAAVAAVVTIVCIISVIPYIALQLKAVSLSLDYFLSYKKLLAHSESLFSDNAFFVAIALSLFAISFGTRYLDTTEHQTGLTYAVALTSVVKLVCFVSVGWLAFSLLKEMPPEDAWPTLSWGAHKNWFARTSSPGSYFILVALGGFAFLLLPRQFHILFVENVEDQGIKRASYIFPIYLLLMGVGVVPVAIAGFHLLQGQMIHPDLVVLAIPLKINVYGVGILAFIGGLSAATAMVAVESVAIAAMVSNHLAMPSLLRYGHNVFFPDKKLGIWVLYIRRFAITGVILLSYCYYKLFPNQPLISMGLLSFALISQLAPALWGSFLWKRGTAFGAITGIMTGMLVWFLIPVFTMLFSEPTHLRLLSLENIAFGKRAFTSIVLLSLSLNSLLYVLVSLMTPKENETDLDDVRFNVEKHFSRFGLSVGDLQSLVARYFGEEQAQESFNRYYQDLNQIYDSSIQADEKLFVFAERLLTSFIGASSARLALILLVRKGAVSSQTAQQLLDDTSAAIQHNRSVLQRAMDNARQGVLVLDRHMHMTAWNKAYLEIYDIPNEQITLGMPLENILQFVAERGYYGAGDTTYQVKERLKGYAAQYRFVRQKLEPSGKTIEIRSSRLPDGGVVSTHTDVSDLVAAEEERMRAQELLEKRVQERTEELTMLNVQLQTAKAEADAANQSKTRFLAAASHDILQPLNAARLYSASIVERDRRTGDAALAENISISLDAVEDILTTLLEISRLDSGTFKAEISNFNLKEMTHLIEKEFMPFAQQKGIDLRFVHSSQSVRSDRRLLRRLIQNLISNAIKYTPSGKVLVGVRLRGEHIRIEIWDTGLGIPESQKNAIFEEFKRLKEGARVAKGIGLGLSIVERIARLLKHPLMIESQVDKGSVFKLTLPRVDQPTETLKTKNETVSSPGGLSNLNVFVIDNEPAILEGMNVLLSGWGCNVTMASGLEDALRKCDVTKLPDVIIADYHLDDDENGLLVVEKLREEYLSEIPAILLTANRSPEMQAEAAEIGAPVLNKPLKPAALRAILSRVQSGKQEV